MFFWLWNFFARRCFLRSIISPERRWFAIFQTVYLLFPESAFWLQLLPIGFKLKCYCYKFKCKNCRIIYSEAWWSLFVLNGVCVRYIFRIKHIIYTKVCFVMEALRLFASIKTLLCLTKIPGKVFTKVRLRWDGLSSFHVLSHCFSPIFMSSAVAIYLETGAVCFDIFVIRCWVAVLHLSSASFFGIDGIVTLFSFRSKEMRSRWQSMRYIMLHKLFMLHRWVLNFSNWPGDLLLTEMN